MIIVRALLGRKERTDGVLSLPPQKETPINHTE
jgi:hypothetical protein